MQSLFSSLRLIGLGAVLAAVPSAVRAQDDAEWNHFGLDFRMGFNIHAKFSEPSSAGLALPPGPDAGLALNHRYSDGFVNVDSSGDQGGVTWNWGYQHASQVQDGDLLMHASGAEGGSQLASGERSDDPYLGLDFSYVRDLGHYKWGQWGVKIAFGYTPIDVRDTDPMHANTETITDTYALNGVVPPLAPYTGSSSGPGPVIGSEPISRISAVTPEVITGNRNVDAGLYDLRLGPTFNIPLCKRISAQAGGGLAVGVVNSHFTFNETVSSGAGLVNESGSDTSTGFVVGGYVEAGFAYRLCHAASLYTGAQFQSLGDFRQSVNGHSARLDFGQSIFYEIGLQFHF
jgi:hypothetical protein